MPSEQPALRRQSAISCDRFTDPIAASNWQSMTRFVRLHPMNRKQLRALRLAALCCLLGSMVTQADGLHAIGVCVAISWGETPIWMGIEASATLASSILSASLFITPDHKTLFKGHLELPMQEEGAAFLRVTAGFYYFEPSQPFPYPLAGIGLSYLPWEQSPTYIRFSGEFIVPLAFPLPMFSISGGWLR